MKKSQVGALGCDPLLLLLLDFLRVINNFPVTLPLKNVSLAEWFNSDKENGNGKNIKSALHARIQARGG